MLTFHGGMKIYPLHLNALTDPFTPQIRAILTALPTADHQTHDHPQTPIKAIATPAIAATIRLPAPRIADLYRENLPYFSRGYHNPWKHPDAPQKPNMGQTRAFLTGGSDAESQLPQSPPPQARLRAITACTRLHNATYLHAYTYTPTPAQNKTPIPTRTNNING